MHRLRHSDAMIVYLNEIIYLFNKKKIIHYGALRSLVISGNGLKKIALFNPRFPGKPKSQPRFFINNSSIKGVGIGRATGVIKVHLDLDGRVKSYEKYGSIPKELERDFLEESGYGVMEDNTHH
jgi:CRISPR-associated endonuclease Csn1